MKRMRQVVALALSLFLVMGPATKVVAEARWYDVSQEYHAGVDYEDMVYEGIDLDALGLLTKQLLDDAAIPDNGDAVIADLEVVLDYVDYIGTQYALINIRYDSDPSDEEVAGEYQECVQLINDAYDMACIAIRQALLSVNGDVLRAYLDDEDAVQEFLEYEDMTDRQRELSEEITALVEEYDNAYLAEYDDDITRNRILAEIYIKLVKLRNEEAQLEGYDNYAEYAYAKVYNRDYTTEEIKEVYKEVEKYIVPLLADLIPYYYTNGSLEKFVPTEETSIETMQPYLAQIDPELTTAFDYMLKHHLYDLAESDTKMNVGYTTTFTSDGSAFIFNAPEEDWYQIETLVHEYGHYNAAFHNMEHDLLAVTNMDVAEINSQGLEVLYMEYAEDMYGDGGTEVELSVLLNLLAVIQDACVYDEFQIAAYSYEGALDVDTLNQMFLEITDRYGYEIFGADETIMYSWVEVPHTFESPMYYISYGTSALATLEIMALEYEDRQAAIDCYMEMTTYGTSLPYRELLMTCGLQDIFEPGAVEAIADGIRPVMDDITARHSSGMNKMVSIVVWVFAGVSLLLVILAIFLGIRGSRKEK